MNKEILRHVARPPRLLYAAPILLYGELLVGMFAVFLAQNPLGAVVVWAVTHPIAIVLTVREPHMDFVLQAWFWRQANRTRTIWKPRGNVYTP